MSGIFALLFECYQPASYTFKLRNIEVIVDELLEVVDGSVTVVELLKEEIKGRFSFIM